MATKYNASGVRTPGGSLVTAADVAASPNAGTLPLGSLFRPMKDVWPAVDAANGPLTANAAPVLGMPTLTGKTLYGWNSGVFNTQSQNWVAVPTGAGQNTSGQSACCNASTPRIWTYGNMTNSPIESVIDFGIVTDATSIDIIYVLNAQYVGTNYHDSQVYAEYNGHMRKLDALPQTSSVGNGLMYRTVSFKQGQEREIRIVLPAQAWFVGVAINSAATVRKAPNKLLLAINGDSWNEAGGMVLAAPIGGGWPTGTYRVGGLPQMIAEATGAAVIMFAQGGTGEYNANDGVSHDANFVDAANASVFHSVSRINDFWTKFGARSPIIWTVGGWNDGTLAGVPYQSNYQTRVLQGIDRWIAKRADIKLIYSGIQPVDIVGGDARSLAIAGQAAACAARPNNVIGFIDQSAMWTTQANTAGTQRNANVNQADTIHLHVKGADMVANWHLADVRKFVIPQAYHLAQLA